MKRKKERHPRGDGVLFTRWALDKGKKEETAFTFSPSHVRIMTWRDVIAKRQETS
jgi:hypothetical protein